MILRLNHGQCLISVIGITVIKLYATASVKKSNAIQESIMSLPNDFYASVTDISHTAVRMMWKIYPKLNANSL
jgi:hypothetical protein